MKLERDPENEERIADLMTRVLESFQSLIAQFVAAYPDSGIEAIKALIEQAKAQFAH